MATTSTLLRLVWLAGIGAVACNPVEIAKEPGSQDSGPAQSPQTGADASTDADVDAGPAALLGEAQSVANAGAACTTDADCCVVVSQCRDQSFVVSTAEYAAEVSLVARYDQAASAAGGSLPASAGCLLCIPAHVQVACVQNKCLGQVIADRLPDGGFPPGVLMQNHCGASGPSDLSAESVGLLLGCGLPPLGDGGP